MKEQRAAEEQTRKAHSLVAETEEHTRRVKSIKSRTRELQQQGLSASQAAKIAAAAITGACACAAVCVYCVYVCERTRALYGTCVFRCRVPSCPDPTGDSFA